jgi:spermidine synthase
MSHRAAVVLVFSTSAAVLVLEILAQRLLAPYLGVSLEVFTGVIGIILAGIAVGAWVGGRAADRVDPSRLPGPLLVGGGLSALAAPLIVDLVGPATPSTGPLSIVLLATVGFFAPAAILSAVTPVVVKIRLAHLAETGSVVGGYSAVGTAGAIFGTFVTGFVLVAAFPTRPIVISVGAALVVAGTALWRRPSLGRLNALAGAAVLAWGLAVVDGPCQYETTYHCAIVEVDPARPTGRTLVLDRVSNSYVDLADPTHLEFRYARLMADAIDATLPDGPLDVVSIGGGGFTFNGYLAAVRPGTEHVTLEIDRLLVDIGHTDLGLAPDADVVVDDARRSLLDVPLGSIDLVIGDAFSGYSVPWHLTTVEYVRQIAQRLTAGGMYTLNVIDHGDLRFARAEAATLAEVFEHVAVLAPPDYLAGRSGGNFVLVASDMRIDVAAIEAALAARGGIERAVTGEELAGFVDEAPILTDDFAPVDQMLTRP